MPSFDLVNYSLRPSKSIQRQIIFDGVRELQIRLNLDKLVFIGFGSIWFTDFVMAHKMLRVNDMVSIEADDVGYARAVFNAPYATVRVEHGRSAAILPALFANEALSRRPWLVWLDYDYPFDESVKDDVRSLIEHSPANSILIFTFNGLETKYGHADDRPGRLRALFGDVVPDELSKGTCRSDRMQEVLADYALDFMQAVGAELSRPSGFVPAFRVIYKDTAPMITVGGVLPTEGTEEAVVAIVKENAWPCRPAERIIAPHLTIREAIILQSQLPSAKPISRELVQRLGFDLDERQIETYQSYYKQYPNFVQIVI